MTDGATTEYAPPMGPRYTQLYLERGRAKSDSERLRQRVAAFTERELSGLGTTISDAIHLRIGADDSLSQYSTSIGNWFRKCSEDDFRDAITVVHSAILDRFKRESYTSVREAAYKWREFCRDAFIEENIAFRVDDQCVVHPFVDEEFAQAFTSLVRGLHDPRLRAVHAEVIRAVDSLGGRNPDPKSAVRAMFEAVEIYAKLAVTSCKVQRLNRNVVNEHLIRTVVARPELNEPAVKAVTHLGEAMIDWIDACHVYRHGQGVNEPSPPPPDLAVALVSTGLAHLRFLLDAAPLQKA